MTTVFLLTAIYFFLGMVTGLFSGLLGIGGGIIVVPVLAYVFHWDHMPTAVVLHIAIGTSLAIMAFTTLRSLWAHLSHSGRDEFLAIAKTLTPTVVIGVVLGGFAANFLQPNSIRVIFSIATFLLALRLFFSHESATAEARLPKTLWLRVSGLIIGSVSGVIGLGAGTTVIPYLLYYQVPMRTALRVSIVLGFIIAIIGALTYYASGSRVSVLPAHCWGYIYWPAWLGVSVGSVLFAPVGAQLSYHLSNKILKRLFALLVLLIGVHMLYFSI